MPMDSIRFSLFPDGWPQGLASAWNEGMTRIVGGGLLSLCLLLAGCSQETGPIEKVDKLKKSAVSEGVVEAVPSAASNVSNKAIVGEGDSKETVSQWSAVIKSQWKEPYGDMRQELVFIGQEIDSRSMLKALNECLLSDDDVLKGEDYWKTLNDPFPVWAESL